MPYQTLLFDLDDTLLDFKAAEHHALLQLFSDQQVEPTWDRLEEYKRINQGLWGLYEQGKLERSVLLAKRFEDFFALFGKQVDGQQMDQRFRSQLEAGQFLIEGSTELLDRLRETHELYAVTNGVGRTQRRRLQQSGLASYFQDVFISEETGYQKPMRGYFDYVFARIPSFLPEETLIIGDSLSSDITGGHLAGIDSCWFNPAKLENPLTITPTYEIAHLMELPAILA